MSIEIKITDTTNVQFPIIIKDKRGNIIYYQNENGYWEQYTYDDNGKELTFKNSFGGWYKKTYDENGYELTFKNSSDDYRIKGKWVTKEVFLAFVNRPEYTMKESVAILGYNFKIKK
jgi:hypothetical protein